MLVQGENKRFGALHFLYFEFCLLTLAADNVFFAGKIFG